jgi:hypothetical protein
LDRGGAHVALFIEATSGQDRLAPRLGNDVEAMARDAAEHHRGDSAQLVQRRVRRLPCWPSLGTRTR